MDNNNSLVSWSGGKDSYYAAMQAKKEGTVLKVLLNVLNENGKISRSHGIPASILQAQAAAIGLPIKMIASSWQHYETVFTAALIELKKDYDLSQAIFGDIDLEAHKIWEENVCKKAGLVALLPLWGKSRKELVMQMLSEGITAMIVSCNKQMGAAYLGKILSAEIVANLENMGIDPCGEGGEFHTLVLNGPLFYQPIKVAVSAKILHDNYWFSQLELLS